MSVTKTATLKLRDTIYAGCVDGWGLHEDEITVPIDSGGQVTCIK
jgi:hypothetical protein